MLVGRTCAQPDRILDETTFDLGVQRRHALIVERDLATDKDVEDDTKAPYVDFRANIDFCVQ